MPRSEHIAAVTSIAQAVRPEVEHLFRQLWAAPELAGMERQSSAALAGFLERHGFAIERSPGGIPTAFIARRSLGTGPRIAILAEYDALPGLANHAVPHRSPNSDRAGHACGHNHIGPANSAAAIIAAGCAASLGLKGEVSVIGCPAEEILWGKLALLQRGMFADYDAILTSHGDYQNGAVSRPCQAVMSGEFLFSGEAGHGGRVGGGNALDAAELAIARANRLRADAYPDVILGHVLRNAGIMPTITPESARLWITARHVSFERARALYDAAHGIAETIAAENRLGFCHLPIAGTRGYLANDVLARLLLECCAAIGLPQWREDEIAWMQDLAHAVRPGETMIPRPHAEAARRRC
jgi:aminobenzoyl-glutamate utilization protein B